MIIIDKDGIELHIIFDSVCAYCMAGPYYFRSYNKDRPLLLVVANCTLHRYVHSHQQEGLIFDNFVDKVIPIKHECFADKIR